MALDHNALFCQEEEESKTQVLSSDNNTLFPPSVFEHDFCWDDDELQSLFIKERQTSLNPNIISEPASFFAARKQAVDFILRISSYHGFSASAAIVAVNYVERFLLDYVSFERERAWVMQLVAVSCLSLAAKVEETHVPLLVDLQMEDAKYLFEAKTIKRMELLILSALKWRMNPVTPLSFIDHIVRRLGLKSHAIRLEFLTRCGDLILSVIADSRCVGYFPSVLATATMVHLLHEVDWCANAIHSHTTMLHLLNITKEEVEECYGVMLDVIEKKSLKRKIMELSSSSSSSSNGAITNSES